LISASIAIAAALVFYVIEDPDVAVTAGLLLFSLAAASAYILIAQGAGIAAAAIILATQVESLSARLSLLALGLVLAIVVMGMNLVGPNRRAQTPLGWMSLVTASILVLTGLAFLLAERTPSAASGALLLIVLAGAIVTRIPSLWPLSAGVFLLTASAFVILAGRPDQANAVGAAAFYCLLSGSLLALVSRKGN
jgi:hypothetical protein